MEWIPVTYPVGGSSDGMGMGGGLIGGVVLGALLGRGGLGGIAPVADVWGIVTPALLASSLTAVTDNANNSVILNKLGSIEASIPFNEAQVQLALAQAVTGLSNQSNVNQTATVLGQSNTNKYISDAIATALAGQNDIKTAIASSGTANLTATLNSKFELSNTIRDDGDKTRALIVAQNDANLQRMLTVAENALAEERFTRRSRETEINITNTNTATAQATQSQFQAQQQLQILANLSAMVGNLANDVQVVRQSQSNINFGVQAGTSQGQAATNNKVGN